VRAQPSKYGQTDVKALELTEGKKKLVSDFGLSNGDKIYIE
jgi:hypothetical protein